MGSTAGIVSGVVSGCTTGGCLASALTVAEREGENFGCCAVTGMSIGIGTFYGLSVDAIVNVAQTVESFEKDELRREREHDHE